MIFLPFSFRFFNLSHALRLTCYLTFSAFKAVLPKTQGKPFERKQHSWTRTVNVSTNYTDVATILKGTKEMLSNLDPDLDNTMNLEHVTFWCRKFHYTLCKISHHIPGIKKSVLSHKSLSFSLIILFGCLYRFFFWFHYVSLVL